MGVLILTSIRSFSSLKKTQFYNLKYSKAFLPAKIKEPDSASLAITHTESLCQLLGCDLVSAAGLEFGFNKSLQIENWNSTWVWEYGRGKKQSKKSEQACLSKYSAAYNRAPVQNADWNTWFSSHICWEKPRRLPCPKPLCCWL